MSQKEPEKNISIDDIRDEIERRAGQSEPLSSLPEQDTRVEASFNAEKDFESILEDSKIHIEQEFSNSTAVLVALTALGKINVFTGGNLSIIGGKPKSGKTTLAAMLIAAAHKTFGSFTGHLGPTRNGIVFLDFEMGAKRTQDMAKLVCKLLGVDRLPENIHFYSLRRYDTATRMIILELIAHRRPETAIIFADGIRDLLHSINDEFEVSNLMTKLLDLLEATSIHFCSILHFNKNDRNPRGTIGTEVSNKCELLISVDKKAEHGEAIHVVKSELSRELEFTSFAFRRVNDTVEIVEDWAPSTKKQGVSVGNIPNEKHQAILAEVFHKTSEYTYGDLVKAVQQAAAKVLGGGGIGILKCKALVTTYYDQKLFSTRKEAQKTMYSLNESAD
jgi:hypothetical protein